MTPLRIFIGFDERETVAYHVLCQSLIERSSVPLAMTPLRSKAIPAFQRPTSKTQATDFSFTRFMVPYLCGYQGVAVFMDCDMLAQADPAELLTHLDAQPDASVLVCPHEYTPKETIKFLGNEQKAYPRKNWTSVMVFRNDRCRTLTPDYVNTASAADLHRLAWVAPQHLGFLPLAWNWLIGEYDEHAAAKVLHWTIGGPYFQEYQDAPHAEAWLETRDRMLRAG